MGPLCGEYGEEYKSHSPCTFLLMQEEIISGHWEAQREGEDVSLVSYMYVSANEERMT